MEAKSEEKKAEESKAVEATKPEVKKAPMKKYIVPDVGQSKEEGIMEGLRGASQEITILSFLPYKDLITVAKSCKYGYNFVMKRNVRKRILTWKPSKEDETKLQNYIGNAISHIASTKS